MRLVILQPNYIPWRGYFDFFKQSDVFVVYDDVQYTKADWRNRNLIKTQDGSQWLTITIDDSNHRNLLIKDAKIINNGWQERHLKQIETCYKHAPYFGEIHDLLGEALNKNHELLCALNMDIIEKIFDYLGVKRKIVYSSAVGFNDLKSTDRLVAICKHLGATEYLSGDAARDYLEVEKFGDIRVLWHRYKEKIYPQLHGEFLSHVSIIDTLMNCGIKTYDII